jgi:chromosome segregation ATPase
MGQRILVFEKNPDFIKELERGFAQYGAVVGVVADLEHAVAAGKRGELDLLLVTAEALGSPSEVFLICKRFKSEDDLARIPLVALGGSAQREAFEQHKKLKRRADDYVELPVTFDALWAKVRPLVSWGRTSSEGGEAKGRIDVDADIDAFAESAFGDLVKTDARPEPVAAPAPANSQGGASAFEQSRLEALVEELTSRAEAAEERASQSERKLKAAEANRPSVHPPPAAVSSRDYLELREQLNRKDKELLALRDEITSRDRRLLEASDRSLVLERAQAELADNIAELTSRLEDALAKVGQYEADLETGRKRSEGLTVRLHRAEENGRALERDLESAKQRHSTEITEARAAHEQHVREMEEQTAADSTRMRSEHASELGALRAAHEAAMRSAEQRSNDALKALQGEREQELAQTKSAHQNEISALRAAHDQTLQTAEREAAARLADAQNTHASVLAAANQAHADATENLRNEHAYELAQTRASLEQHERDALATRESELNTAHASVLAERDERHAGVVADLNGRLQAAESRGNDLAQKLQQTEQAAQELERRLRNEVRNLEGHLSARTEERDLTQNELTSARAQIASLEQLSAQRAERIGQLEGSLSHAEHRIGLQSSKIAADNELLERVRRALGIGMGLLEQQKQNVVDGL